MDFLPVSSTIVIISQGHKDKVLNLVYNNNTHKDSQLQQIKYHNLLVTINYVQ